MPGMGPERLLWWRSSWISDCKLPSASGMLPCKEFCERMRRSSCGSAPKEDGIEPTKPGLRVKLRRVRELGSELGRVAV